MHSCTVCIDGLSLDQRPIKQLCSVPHVLLINVGVDLQLHEHDSHKEVTHTVVRCKATMQHFERMRGLIIPGSTPFLHGAGQSCLTHRRRWLTTGQIQRVSSCSIRLYGSRSCAQTRDVQGVLEVDDREEGIGKPVLPPSFVTEGDGHRRQRHQPPSSPAC